jgi:hypothetical protein
MSCLDLYLLEGIKPLLVLLVEFVERASVGGALIKLGQLVLQGKSFWASTSYEPKDSDRLKKIVINSTELMHSRELKALPIFLAAVIKLTSGWNQ